LKKQGISKLVLSRETVRILDDRLKGVVAGQFTKVTCDNSCDSAINSFCVTCFNHTC
jgi:hypothetical protein